MFTGWMEKENQGLQFEWRTRTKIYRLNKELEPKSTGWMKKENQGLQVE